MAEKVLTEARVKGLIAKAIEEVIGQLTEQIELVNKAMGTKTAELIQLANKGRVSTDDVQKIIDNLKNFVSVDALEERLSGLITKDQWNAALDGMLSAPVALSGIHPGLAAGLTLLEPIAAKHLTGLMFRSSKSKKTEAGKTNIPIERALTPDDVLSWKDNGDTVSIVAADGQKHTVDKE